MRRQQDAIQYGSSTIGYSITRSAARSTVAVSVHPDGTVAITAPKGTRRDRVGEIVTTKANWILRQQEAYRRQHSSRPKQFVSGESLYFLGRQYKLKLRVRADQQLPEVQLIRGQFLVHVPPRLDASARYELVRTALKEWFRLRAEKLTEKLAIRFSENLGLSYRSIQIRDMTKRWGSGGRNGRLAFNWRIVMAPKRLLEYVVVHELCHLRHVDHSRDFWRLLERAMPDFERRRIELAIHGSKYDL